jgi:hypothetical protein
LQLWGDIYGIEHSACAFSKTRMDPFTDPSFPYHLLSDKYWKQVCGTEKGDPLQYQAYPLGDNHTIRPLFCGADIQEVYSYIRYLLHDTGINAAGISIKSLRHLL